MSGRDIHQGHAVAGIVGFGTYAPKDRISAEELARRANVPVERFTRGIGFDYVHIANDDEHPSTMGLAAAVVLRRDHPRYQLLSFAEHTDGDLGDLLRIDVGGTRLPFTKEFSDWEQAYVRVDGDVFADLINRVYLKEYVSVINRAVERSGHVLADMEFILMNQVKASLREHILDTIGMPQDHTYISLDEYGHMGPADSLFTMAMAHRKGLLPEGKLAILAASGLGFSWVASVLRC